MRPLVATHIGTFCTDGSKPSVNSTSLPQNPQSGAPSCYRMTAGYSNTVRFATCNCHTCNTTFGVTVSTHGVNIKTFSLYTHRYSQTAHCVIYLKSSFGSVGARRHSVSAFCIFMTKCLKATPLTSMCGEMNCGSSERAPG